MIVSITPFAWRSRWRFGSFPSIFALRALLTVHFETIIFLVNTLLPICIW